MHSCSVPNPRIVLRKQYAMSSTERCYAPTRSLWRSGAFRPGTFPTGRIKYKQPFCWDKRYRRWGFLHLISHCICPPTQDWLSSCAIRWYLDYLSRWTPVLRELSSQGYHCRDLDSVRCVTKYASCSIDAGHRDDGSRRARRVAHSYLTISVKRNAIVRVLCRLSPSCVCVLAGYLMGVRCSTMP
eukprot:10156-Rhodomonas_salina.3